jgi:hypothetical protein
MIGVSGPSVRRLAAVAALALACSLGTAGRASARDAPVSLTVNRAAIPTQLGRRFAFRTTISNPGGEPTAPLVAHLNVVSLRDGVYVDPEDWSSHRTQYLPVLAAHGSTTVSWRLQAVNGGSFAVYVVVLPRSGSEVLAAGPPVRVSVAERKTLDSGGVLPLVLGVPALLGLLWLGLTKRRSRA